MERHDLIPTWFGNSVSASAILATFIGWTPSIAALVALIWYFIQIYESETVRNWIANRRLRKLARLRARLTLLEAKTKSALPGPGTG